MSTTATSLKLPSDLKSRIERYARLKGKTPHAYMVESLAVQVEQDALREQFHADGLAELQAVKRSGQAYDGKALATYHRKKAAGQAATKPRLKKWPG